MSDHYFVVLLDVMDSARLADRQALSMSLLESLAAINQQFCESLYAPFEITRGDEAAAVLTSIKSLYRICRTLNEFLHPARYRMVISFGELNAGLQTRRSTIIDGPAFFQARRMMRQLKRSYRFVSFSTRAVHIDPVLQSLMNQLLWQWSAMTSLQQQIVSLYLRERNQVVVAKRLGRSQQQVQNTLRRCGWEIIDEAGQQAERLLTLMQRAH